MYVHMCFTFLRRTRIKQCSNNCHDDNELNTYKTYTTGKGVAMTMCLPSTNYSILYSDGANGETLEDRKDEYSALDRSHGGVWSKTNQRKILDGYSRLCHKTV